MEDEKNSQSDNNFMLNKFPYLCSTSNLIDNFMIIGYDEDVRNKEIYRNIETISNGSKIPNDVKQNLSETNYFSVYSNNNQPTILSAVCSRDLTKVMLDNEMITKLIFPTPPPVYYILDDVKSTAKKYEPNQYSVVFFMNSDTLEAKSKIPFHGYTFIFYEKREERIDIKNSIEQKNLRVYIPKAFCIISQFPFFSQYFNLAKSIYEQMLPEKDNIIPIEIMIYNIINFTPAPINRGMLITFLPKDESVFKKEVENENRNLNAIHPPNHSSSSSLLNSAPIEREKEKSHNIDKSPESKPNKEKKEKHGKKDKDPLPNFICLSGYPLFDFNLSEIFNILPLENIVEILIFNFLEIDMLFFSKNIEVLNLVMYIIASFNYPCNDSIYLWHIVSVSKNELEDSSANSKFIGKPFTTMVGVNCPYDEKTIETSNFTKSMFIADLDKKEFLFKYNQHMDDTDKEETEKLIKVYLYIDKIINDKSLGKHDLEKNIKKLVSELELISKKVIHSNYNHGSQIIPKFLIPEVNYQSNKKTQEIFYSFVLNILKHFYKSYHITSNVVEDFKTNSKTHEYKIKKKEEEGEIIEEEKFFYEMFTSCTKFNSYMINFLNLNTTMELYHIPLIFSEEFLHLNKTNEREYENAKHFELMDNFYMKEPKTEIFNFKEFYFYFNENLRVKMFNEIPESDVLVINKKKVNGKKKLNYQYRKIELDNNVLYRYIYHLNNLTDNKLVEIFPAITRLESSSIKRVRYNEVSQSIELGYITDKIYTIRELISLSIIMFYTLTIHFMTEAEFNQSFEVIIELLIKQRYCLRRYITILLSIYYRYAKTLQHNNLCYKYLLIAYHRIMEFALSRNITGNEEMQKIFKDFLVIDNQGINYNDYLKKTDLKSEEYMKSLDQIVSQEEKDSDKEKPNTRKESQNSMDLKNPKTPIAGSENLQAQQFTPHNSTSTPGQNSASNEKSESTIHSNTESKKKTEKVDYIICLTQNICRDGMKKEDFILKMADNVYFDGDINFKCSNCHTQIKPRLKYKSKKSNEVVDSDVFTPRRIYNICNSLMNDFLTKFKPEAFDCELLKDIMVNLLFFQMHIRTIQIEKPLLILWDYSKRNLLK